MADKETDVRETSPKQEGNRVIRSGSLSPVGNLINPTNVRIKGYLWKKHRKNKLWVGWHKRYFALVNNRLLYFKNDREMQAKMKAPRGEIALGADCTIGPSPEDPGKLGIAKFIMVVPPGGMIHLGGSSKEDADEWIKKLREVIKEQKTDGSRAAQVEESSSDDDDFVDEEGLPASHSMIGRKDSGLVNAEMSPTVKKRMQGNFTGAHKHGILYKRKTGIFAGWHQRYFILRGNELSYFKMDLKNNKNTLSKKCFRGLVTLTKEFQVGYDTSWDPEKKKKSEWHPFSIIGPNVKIGVATKSKEEAQSWVAEIQSSIESAPGKVRRGSMNSVLLEDGNISRAHRPSRPKSPTAAIPSTNEKRRGGHFRTNTIPDLAYREKPSFNLPQSPTSQHSSSSPNMGPPTYNGELLEGWLWKKYIRKKYWRGWHLRYFMLSGNTLQYFKDGRKKKVIGSVVLGSDCCVDFPGTTTNIKKNKSLFNFTVFLDGQPSQTVNEKNALILGTPKEEDAKRWTEAIRASVYNPHSKGNTKFHLHESDDEGEEETIPEMAVRYGDKIRLFTRSAYAPQSSGGTIGVFHKPGGHDVFVVPPNGLAVAPELFDNSTFFVIDPSWPREFPASSDKKLKELPGFGSELRYGDKIQLCDELGRIWCQDGGYAAPKRRTEIREKTEGRLIFHRMHQGSREGDIVHFGENNILIEALAPKSHKLRPIRNYKRSTSRLVGGYLSCNGVGRPIHFTIFRDAAASTEEKNRFSGINCKMEVRVVDALTDDSLFLPRQIESGEKVKLGTLYGGIHKVSLSISEHPGGSQSIVIPLPNAVIPARQLALGPTLRIESTHDLDSDLVLSCSWECKKWWSSQVSPQTMRKAVSKSQKLDLEWLLIASVALYCCIKTLWNNDTMLAISITMMILAIFPVLLRLRGAIAGDEDTDIYKTIFQRGITSRGTWSFSAVLREKRKDDANPRPQLRDVQSFGSEPGEIKHSPVDTRIDAYRSSCACEELPTSFKGQVNAGTSIKFSPEGEKMPNSFTNSHYNNFRVRAGPNYRKLKTKKPSKRELYSLLYCDTFRTDRKVTDFTTYLKFEPKEVDELVLLQEKLEEKRPDLKLPPIFTITLTWPNFAPPNPLWRAPVDGPGILFSLVFKAGDWWSSDDSNDVPALRLLSTWINSDFKDSHRERFKVAPLLVNIDECKIEGLVKSIVSRFNGKPFLSRPQHVFKDDVTRQMDSSGKAVDIRYHNISIDGYEFQYFPRQTCWSLMDKSTSFIIDMGFVIEARDDEEMPEQMLGHVRFNYLDAKQFPCWTPEEDVK